MGFAHACGPMARGPMAHTNRQQMRPTSGVGSPARIVHLGALDRCPLGGEPNRPDPADFLEWPLVGKPNENMGSPFPTTHFLSRLRFLRFCRGDSFAPPVFTSTHFVSFLPVSQLLRGLEVVVAARTLHLVPRHFVPVSDVPLARVQEERHSRRKQGRQRQR